MTHSSFLFLVCAASFLALTQSAAVQTINGNGAFTNGNCNYVGGVIWENGVNRKATAEENAQAEEFQKKMDEWGQLFDQYMEKTMSNIFTPNYVAPPEPIAPKNPCLCQTCSITRN